MTCDADPNACWACYLRSLPEDAGVPRTYYEASAFGADGETELADRLATLVAQGIKTATSSLLQYYQSGPHPMERVGDHCVVLTSNGQPYCIIGYQTVHTSCPRKVSLQL